MKNVSNIICILILSFCHSQNNKLLLDQTLVQDLSESPLYPRLVERNDTTLTRWKEEFKYIDSITIHRISYLSDSLNIKGYIVKPKRPGKYPCIIYNRGGSGKFGTLSDVHAAIFLGKLAKEGYVVIASQYRGNGGSEGNDEFGGSDINDVLVLPEVLKEIKEADILNIGMYGWSRGGMMTYIALTKTNKIKVAVVGGAISDAYKLARDRQEIESEVLAKFIPNFQENKTEELNRRSPIKWVYKFPENVPILMLHGNVDWRVRPEHSLEMALEFQNYNIPYRLIIFDGGNHSIIEHKKEVNEQTIYWFNKFLKSH